MSMQDQFEIFYKKIKLTKIQRNDAKTKYRGVCKKLHDSFYPELTYNGKTKLLIGSYGKKTHIRPPRDVDVIFIMPDDKFEQYDNYQSNGQSKLLQDIRAILNEKYTATDSIKAWGKVVLIEFSNNTHNVELLPAWRQDNGSFKLPNTENGGSWEVWNPKSEINAIEESNTSTGGITRFLIRTLKKWADNCCVELKSYQIEEKVLAFLNQYQINDSSHSLLVKDLFSYINDQAIDGATSHIKTAFDRANKAYNFEQKGMFESATAEWKKIFSDDFPKYEEKSLASLDQQLAISVLRDKYPTPSEEFLDKNYGISTNLNSNYRIKLDAIVKQNGFQDHPLSYYLINKMLLKKEKVLTFKIKGNIQGNYNILWKVRNFGAEAENAEDLRGKISNDSGYEQKVEHTKYIGEHLVECYVIQNNVCIAMDSIFVPIQ